MKKILFGFIICMFAGLTFAKEPNDTTKFFTVKISNNEKHVIREHFVAFNDIYEDEMIFDPTENFLVLTTDISGNRMWEKSDIPGLSIKLKKINEQFEIKAYQVNRINETEYVQIGKTKLLNFNEKYLLPIKYSDKEVFIEIKTLKEIIFN